MKKFSVSQKHFVARFSMPAKGFGKRLLSKFIPFFVLSVFFYLDTNAQKLDVPYVPTRHEVVEKMLDAANVGPGDYLIDLGSGDGRIVIAAAKRGATGHGVDIDPKRISEANQNAVTAGVEDKVRFIEGDIFNTDIGKASVVTMYLLNSINIRLRPFLLENLKPGTRVVSNDFDMDEWKPDANFKVDKSDVYFWIIPAKVEGKWNWTTNGKTCTMTVDQSFQEIRLQVTSGNTHFSIANSRLTGEKIRFAVIDPSTGTNYDYTGQVNGNRISGTVKVHNGNKQTIEDWNAVLN